VTCSRAKRRSRRRPSLDETPRETILPPLFGHLRRHPGPQFVIDEPLADSDPARLFIFTDQQDLLVARIGEAGVTIRAGRSHADVPYQCDSHPADVAAALLGTTMKGTI